MIIPDIDDLVLEYDEESGIEELGCAWGAATQVKGCFPCN